MDNEKMTEVISQTLEKLEREKYMKRISELEYFPFKSLSEVREKLSKRKINFHIYSDPHFINKFGSAQSKTINKIIRTVQNLIIIATYIFPLVLAINNSNFLYLFCLPIIYFAILKTTPSLYRPLFSLTSIILLVISFFISNPIVISLILSFAVPNLILIILRGFNEGTILNIILKNEEAFVRGYLEKVFSIWINNLRKPIFPDFPEVVMKHQYVESVEALNI